MRFMTVGRLVAALILAALAVPAPAQYLATPPAPLWQVEANGDAVQTDLGFILPSRIGAFERKGFTSTRPDGGSTMTWYENADGLSLRILIHLRVDVRGFPMTGRGGDALDRNWTFLQHIGSRGALALGEEIVHRRIGWNGAEQPNAIFHLSRFKGDNGGEIQGMWYRNIGVWAVLALASGPEARRADIEAAGAAAMALPWPGAPRGAELVAEARGFLGGLRDCGTIDRTGSGRPVEVDGAVGAMIGIFLVTHFSDTSGGRDIHPVADAGNYCRLETFRAGQRELVALVWRGDRSGDRAARFAFMVPDGSAFFQFETNLPSGALASQYPALGITRPVQLTYYNRRAVAVTQVFTDWPSYEEAKRAVTLVATEGQPPVVVAQHPARNISVSVNQARVTDSAAAAEPPAAD